jgi:hypothetical protein
MIQAPQSFIVREECAKAAWEHGFRRPLGEQDGWAAFASTTVPGTIHLAASGPRGPWWLGLDHPGVIEALEPPASKQPGPGQARLSFAQLGDLYAVLARVYQLAASMPDAPLREFQAQVAGLPTTTEAERLVVQRIGQNLFRARLLDYWQGRCPLTGITDPDLLRASHIIPWSACATDAERLDVHNGLLLSALWDAAFDRGLVTFDDSGQPQFSPSLSAPARAELRWQTPLALTDRHRQRLAWHRSHLFAGEVVCD